MIFGFKQQQPLLDDESVLWMLDVFDWVQQTFRNAQLRNSAGKDRKRLIMPTNEDFPGRGNSVEGMASLIFTQVLNYIGLSELTCVLENERGMHPLQSETLPARVNSENDRQLVFFYHTQSLRDPEVLIASFIHQLTFYLVNNAPTPPPGGTENLPHAAELLAVFMGFGIIMANTANTQKIRSCGSCSGPAVERDSYLSQYDITYALAIYCILNRIPLKITLQQLKKALRPFYKKASKEILSANFVGTKKLETLSKYYLEN